MHLRKGETVKKVFPWTIKQFPVGAVIMGNHPFPDQTDTIEKTLAYRQELEPIIPADSKFKPCMTCYLTDHTTPEEVVRGYREGVWCAVKLYMADQNGEGGTTGSHHGVKNLQSRYPVIAAMEKEQIPFLGHFEAVEDDVDEFDREIVSLERDLVPMLRAFPGLKVVFEHITDGRAADFVAQTEHQVRATVTCHHLMLNRNALFRGGMNPDHWCKPVVKRESHRRKVRQYVTSGNRRFGAGTDSAPHDEVAKSQPCGCPAGMLTEPIASELYTTIFDEDGRLEHLENFLAVNFLDWYRVQPSPETMTMERKPSTGPQKVGEFRVFGKGMELSWTRAA